jgi:hypothetical protein
MSKGDISAVERVIANTIIETARGDPDGPPASSPLWPRQASVSSRRTGERTPH